MTNLYTTPPDFSAATDINASSKRSPEWHKECKQKIPELLQLERLIREHSQVLHACCEQTLQYEDTEFPLYSITLGARAPTAPTLLFTGGIHGIERIGSQV